MDDLKKCNGSVFMDDLKKCNGSGDCSNCVFDTCVFNEYWDDLPDEWFEQFVDSIVVDTISD